MSVCTCVSISTQRLQNRVLDVLELELPALVSYQMRILGTKHRYSVRAACTLNH